MIHRAFWLQVMALAYDLAKRPRQLVLPKPVRGWTLTTLREKRIKIMSKALVKYVNFPLADVAVPRHPLSRILKGIRQVGLACPSG